MWEMQAASTCWTAPKSTAAFRWLGWAIWAEESWHLACLLETRGERRVCGFLSLAIWFFTLQQNPSEISFIIYLHKHTHGFAFACSTIAVCSRGTCATHNKKGRIQVKRNPVTFGCSLNARWVSCCFLCFSPFFDRRVVNFLSAFPWLMSLMLPKRAINIS